MSATKMSYKFQFGLVACARWESAHICEWIEYHRSIGFQRFYIYCNDDDPTELRRVLLPYLNGSDPIAVFHHNPFQGNQPQSFRHFYRNYAHEVEWVSALDIDEFINLKKWNSISDLISEFENVADAIYFNWHQFGPGDYQTRPSTDVLTTYTKCEKDIHILTKHITRTSAVDFNILQYVSDNMNHYWFPPFEMRGVNILGDDIDIYWDNFPLGTRERYLDQPGKREAIMEAAVVHHYIFKSRSDFDRRIQRGLLGGMIEQKIWHEIASDGRADAFINQLNAESNRSLADYWIALTSVKESERMIPTPQGRNVALGRTCTQSSTCSDSRSVDPQVDACGAVNGNINGAYGFHTAYEEGAWWQVDLGNNVAISEIRLYNRMGNAEIELRLRNFEIFALTDAEPEIVVYRHEENKIGGIDGRPLIVRFADPISCRYIRIQLCGINYLHLDEVQVWSLEPDDKLVVEV